MDASSITPAVDHKVPTPTDRYENASTVQIPPQINMSL